MEIIGIDPGVSGAIVIIDSTTSINIASMTMPLLIHGGKKTINSYAIAQWLNECLEGVSNTTAIVENVHAMPGQGVTSMFSFGRSFGTIEGVLGALAIPCIHISPQKWKSIHGFHSKDKDEPRSNLIRRFPKWKDLALKGKGQALADAYYIANSWNKIK